MGRRAKTDGVPDSTDTTRDSGGVEDQSAAGSLGAVGGPVAEADSSAGAAPDRAGSGEADRLTLERDQPATDQPPVRVRRKYTRRQKSETPAVRSQAQITADKTALSLAFQGTFEALSMALGDHWQLLPARELEGKQIPAQSDTLAGVWDPVFERYGGKVTAEAFMWISASTVSVAILVPRIKVSVQHEAGIIGWIKRKIAARKARREG